MEFSQEIKIGDFTVSDSSRTFIIAEAGVNHNGDRDIAEQMIKVAADAGVDAVKFQYFKTENLILNNVSKAPYQLQTTGKEETQFEMLKKLEVSMDDNLFFKKKCEENGVQFLTTAFDEMSLEELDKLDMSAYKVSSTDVTNLAFVKKVARKGKPIILSSGMTYLKEIKKILEKIYPVNKDIILLQCSSNYPVSDEEVNLNVLTNFKNEFGIIFGYSDHTEGIGASPYAVAMGAKLIEKHFTLNKDQKGPDHKASLDPDELFRFVKEIRRVEKMKGDFNKQPVGSEKFTRQKLQKCLVAKNRILKGEVFTEQNIVAKRTGGVGISPIDYEKVIGQKAKREFLENDVIEL